MRHNDFDRSLPRDSFRELKKTIKELSFPFYSRVRAVVARHAGCSRRIGLPTVPGEQAGGTVRVVMEGVELEQGTAAGEEVQSKQGRRT